MKPNNPLLKFEIEKDKKLEKRLHIIESHMLRTNTLLKELIQSNDDKVSTEITSNFLSSAQVFDTHVENEENKDSESRIDELEKELLEAKKFILHLANSTADMYTNMCPKHQAFVKSIEHSIGKHTDIEEESSKL